MQSTSLCFPRRLCGQGSPPPLVLLSSSVSSTGLGTHYPLNSNGSTHPEPTMYLTPYIPHPMILTTALRGSCHTPILKMGKWRPRKLRARIWGDLGFEPKPFESKTHVLSITLHAPPACSPHPTGLRGLIPFTLLI